MVRRGLANIVHEPVRGAVLITPYADKPVSRLDLPFIRNHGVQILDCPWEKLEGLSSRYRSNGYVLRALPADLEACNPFYRRDKPIYFTDIRRFSTAEAAAYGLAAAGFYSRGEELAQHFGFLLEYRRNTAGAQPKGAAAASAEVLPRGLGSRMDAPSTGGRGQCKMRRLKP